MSVAFALQINKAKKIKSQKNGSYLTESLLTRRAEYHGLARGVST